MSITSTANGDGVNLKVPPCRHSNTDLFGLLGMWRELLLVATLPPNLPAIEILLRLDHDELRAEHSALDTVVTHLRGCRATN
jgi:hypothetical protein